MTIGSHEGLDRPDRTLYSCEDSLSGHFFGPTVKCHFSDDLDVARRGCHTVLQRGVVIVQPSASEGSSSSTAVAGPPPAKKRSLGFFLKDATDEPQPVLSPEQQMKAESHAYEAIPKLDPKEDPLYWWKVRSPRFPGLPKLAVLFISLCNQLSI